MSSLAVLPRPLPPRRLRRWVPRSSVSIFLWSPGGWSAERILVFSLVSCVAAVHAIRAAMHSLKKTGSDYTSAQGMNPKAFFEVMGTLDISVPQISSFNRRIGLQQVVQLDAEAGGSAFKIV